MNHTSNTLNNAMHEPNKHAGTLQTLKNNFTGMKKSALLIFVAAMVVLAASCKKEDDKSYYIALGIINIKTDSTIIVTDAGERLLVMNKGFVGSTVKDKDRVNVNFSTVSGTLPTNIDYMVELTSVEKILLKQPTILTAAIADSIGNDPLQVNSLWVSRDFLNLDFSYYGGYSKHYINLIHQEGTLRTDTIDLEVRHNDNDETGTLGYYGFVSFDLSSLRSTVADSVKLRVKAKEYNNRTREVIFTYKY
jgi:hypothetical protein